MKKYIVIVAGGKGLRMGNDIPKQFLELNGIPILMHTIKQFFTYDNSISIILVLPSIQIELWKSLCYKFSFDINHQIISGGDERFYSVKNGLSAINDDNSIVAIHDGVRPLVSIETIDRCFSSSIILGNAIPAIPIVDSLRLIDANCNEVLDRNKVRLIQTPQTFRTRLIKEAYNQNWHSGYTDDATVFESLGNKINLVEGNIENIKVTSPFDLKVAELFLLK